jgi:hypothetical protein
MGCCIHAVDYLFNEIGLNISDEKKFQVKISYLEIYNEQVIDLLVDSTSNLMIVEDPQKGIIVPDLSEYSVKSSKELITLIIKGNSKRTMAATGENLFSSRSHAILQIIVEQKTKIRDTKEEYLLSKFLLVDLAGSERSGLEKGIRSQEGKNINKSLLSLGTCINLLSDKSKKGSFVPYRDSKLTRLLKDSLSGNIMSVMISCISPSPTCYDETVNTLKYATKARKIEKTISKNVKEVQVHISQYKEIIDTLKSEILQLKNVIKNQTLSNEIKSLSINQDQKEKERDNSNDNSIKRKIDFNNIKDNNKDNSYDKLSDNSGDNSKFNTNINIDNRNLSKKIYTNDSKEEKDNITSTNININKYTKINNNKNSSTLKSPNLKNQLNTEISAELNNIKKSSFNNKFKNEFSNEMNPIEGSNLLLFANNASKLSNNNSYLNSSGNNQQQNKSFGNVNRSNGLPTVSMNKNQLNNNNIHHLNNSNLSGNTQNQNNNSNNNGPATKSPKPNLSLLSNYSKPNAIKEKKYSEMSRYANAGNNNKDKDNNKDNNNNNNNYNNPHQTTQENEKEKEKQRNSSCQNFSPNNKNIQTMKLKNYNFIENTNSNSNINTNNNMENSYINYKRFQIKNGDEEYDIDAFARNIDQ